MKEKEAYLVLKSGGSFLMEWEEYESLEKAIARARHTEAHSDYGFIKATVIKATKIYEARRGTIEEFFV